MQIPAERARVLAAVAERLAALPRDRPQRVAVDGITAAGKSTFGRELAAAVVGRPALHLSTDDFHHLSAHRHRRADRARGYYEDAYDLNAVRRLLLDPLGPSGDRWYRARSHDLASDALVDEPPQLAPVDAVVVVDGSFLQRPELAGAWDVVIYLDVDYAVAEERGVRRDADALGPEAARLYRERYHAACRLYAAEVGPAARADVLIDHHDPAAPGIVRAERG